MQKEAIHQAIQALSTKYKSMTKPTSLQDSVRMIYCKLVLQRLLTIFNENDHIVQTLTDFLDDNWALINGTSLSYTAARV